MRYLWLFLPLLVCGEEGFMTDYEYGEMLYNNPRGVSCAECHGPSGEGKVIVSYKEKMKRKTIEGDDIRHSSLAAMVKSVNQFHKVMPHYYLTDKEVETIYQYLQKKNSVYLKNNPK